MEQPHSGVLLQQIVQIVCLKKEIILKLWLVSQLGEEWEPRHLCFTQICCWCLCYCVWTVLKQLWFVSSHFGVWRQKHIVKTWLLCLHLAKFKTKKQLPGHVGLIRWAVSLRNCLQTALLCFCSLDSEVLAGDWSCIARIPIRKAVSVSCLECLEGWQSVPASREFVGGRGF